MVMVYINNCFSINRIAEYLRKEFLPQVYEILGTDQIRIFSWETILAYRRRSFIISFLDVIGSTGMILFLLLPEIVTLFLINSDTYVLNRIDTFEYYPMYWVYILRFVAYVMFFLSLLAVILHTYYSVITQVSKDKDVRILAVK